MDLRQAWATPQDPVSKEEKRKEERKKGESHLYLYTNGRTRLELQIQPGLSCILIKYVPGKLVKNGSVG